MNKYSLNMLCHVTLYLIVEKCYNCTCIYYHLCCKLWQHTCITQKVKLLSDILVLDLHATQVVRCILTFSTCNAPTFDKLQGQCYPSVLLSLEKHCKSNKGWPTTQNNVWVLFVGHFTPHLYMYIQCTSYHKFKNV